MSKCINLSSAGRKRSHKYGPDDNKCQHCGHVTTHGANFEKVKAIEATKNK